MNTISILDRRHKPLSLDNDLLAAEFRFGKSQDNEVPFPCHLDSYTAMNTGNLLLHMWIITTYSEIIAS